MRQGGPYSGSPRRDALEQREYDPRREERRRATRVALPDDVDPRMLDQEARQELRSLSKEVADLTARHLVMTGRLLDDEPERALAHARAARALAGRIGMVREAVGLAAYAAGEWQESLSELRAARRITGRAEHLAVLADCERALGRPDRALAIGADPEVGGLPQDERVELTIVLSGARRDLGQADAAVLLLQEPARRTTATRPWAARLWYAHADALLAAGRDGEAREWFARTAELDQAGETDAADRLLELDGVIFEDIDYDGADEAPPLDKELADYVAATWSASGRPAPAPGASPAAVPTAEEPVEPVKERAEQLGKQVAAADAASSGGPGRPGFTAEPADAGPGDRPRHPVSPPVFASPEPTLFDDLD